MPRFHCPKMNEILELTETMIELADEGDQECLDDRYAILYGIIRDSAYHIRLLALDEIEQRQMAQ